MMQYFVNYIFDKAKTSSRHIPQNTIVSLQQSYCTFLLGLLNQKELGAVVVMIIW
jgi:hypothetical protein